MKYRASVIVSIYNSSEFLFDLLVDIKRQTIFSEVEFLLLDCGDGIDDYLTVRKFLPCDNLRYVKCTKRSVYEAWNLGIQMAMAPLLSNWNTDDRRAFDSLEKQVSFLEANPDCDVCYGPTIVSTVPNEVFEFCSSQNVYPALDGSLENHRRHNSPHCLPVWRKSIHDRWGDFDTSYFSAADYDMWFRVLKGGGKMGRLPDPVGLYYRNPTGVSSNNKTIKKAIDECLAIRAKYA